MSIRTLSELEDVMSGEFAWRKKELHSLKTLVIANEKTHSCDLHIRAAITLLYAHWEGFIRQISRFYLEYVARRRLRNEELSPHFLAMAISGLVRAAEGTSKIQPCLDIVDFFRAEMPVRSRLDWESGVNTKSNLKSEVFREIVLRLGLDYSRFSTKEKLLDEKLLKNRNQIAHGQYLLVDFDEYVSLHEEILGMMQDFYNQIDNCANLGAFRSTPQAV
ncbi:MAG: MAE_28990/MAE_18760 family HEPN-like nuclease [Planctomycetota bacterium]|nr:MAE_28990/MAE_18760 family HEPN-like nuclease [Planctomycetota bacterium]